MTTRPWEPVGPRTWKPNGPGSFRAPEGVTVVADRQGIVWRKDGTRWTYGKDQDRIRWWKLVEVYGPLTEISIPQA